MNRTIFATFGWTEAPVISSILRYGLKKGDRIKLITPTREDERSVAALRDLKKFIENYIKEVEVITLRIDVENFMDGVLKLKKEIESEVGREVIINLSGGMRVLVLMAYIAASLSDLQNLLIELETEDRKVLSRVPKLRVEELARLKTLPWPTHRVMLELTRGPMNAAELRRRLNIPASTFHRTIEELVSKGYVIKEKTGKTFILSLTEHGRLISELSR